MHFWDPCLATYYPWLSTEGVYHPHPPLTAEECVKLFTTELEVGDAAAVSSKKMLVHTVSILVRMEGALSIAITIAAFVALTQPIDCRWQTHLTIFIFCFLTMLIHGNHAELLVGRWFGNNNLALNDNYYKPHGSPQDSAHFNQIACMGWGVQALCHFISCINGLVEMSIERANIEKMWSYIEKVRDAKLKAKQKQSMQNSNLNGFGLSYKGNSGDIDNNLSKDAKEEAASAAGKTKVH